MSLEELLKDTESSSAWQTQKQKLIRVAFGLGTAATALIAAVVILVTTHGRHVSQAAAQEPEANDLARLMRMQNETDSLKDSVHQMRKVASESEAESRPSARRGRVPREPSEIISYEPGDGFTNLDKAREAEYIPTGAVFQAQLLTPIKTSVERTMVMAEVTNEFRMDMTRKIAKGSRLIGRARLNPVLKGVIVEFETLVSPAGLESPISGLALSRNALPEIEGLFFSDKLVNYGTALAFGFLSGFADASRTTDVTLVGALPNVSVNNSVASGFSTAAFQIADEALQDIRNHSVEYVVVPAGERVFVALTHRYDIPQGKKNDLLY